MTDHGNWTSTFALLAAYPGTVVRFDAGIGAALREQADQVAAATGWVTDWTTEGAELVLRARRGPDQPSEPASEPPGRPLFSHPQ